VRQFVVVLTSNLLPSCNALSERVVTADPIYYEPRNKLQEGFLVRRIIKPCADYLTLTVLVNGVGFVSIFRLRVQNYVINAWFSAQAIQHNNLIKRCGFSINHEQRAFDFPSFLISSSIKKKKKKTLPK